MFRSLFRHHKKAKRGLVPPQALATWIESQVRAQVPRMRIYQQLLAMQLDAEHPARYRAAAQEVMILMFIRNHRGTKLELAGQLEAAIAQYEANLCDQYGETYPYYRLRLLYAQRRDYANALRVCEAYLRLPEPLAAQHKAAFTSARQQFKTKLTPPA
jgi:hypothetical protein